MKSVDSLSSTFCDRLLLMFALAGISVSAVAAPRLQTGPDAEVTYDGLHRVDRTVMDDVWVKPDFDLEGYDSLLLVSAGVAYRAVDNEGRRYVPGRTRDSEFYIDLEARERLEQELREAFVEELVELERFEIVSEPGPGVLILAAGVFDVVSYVPPTDDCFASRCEIYMSDVGAATLALELKDSVSGEILARIIDRRAAESAGWAVEVNSITVWGDVQRLASLWARRVRNGLEEYTSADDLERRRR